MLQHTLDFLGFNMTDTDGYICLGLLLCAIVILWRLWLRQDVKVNCWFCGYDNVVPRYKKLWWICAVCDQYNGFGKDGGYSNEIPGMFNDSVTPRFCATQNVKTTNVLCTPCEKNQSRIVEGLADFSPSDDRYFDEELEIYKRGLDAKFNLCLSCRTLVSDHLQQQNQQIQQTYNNNNQVQRIEKGVRRLNVKLDNPRTFLLGIYKFTHVLSLLAAIWLCRHTALNTKTDFVLINASLIFSTGTFLMYLYMKCDVVGCLVSIMWLLILIYGNFKTKDSRYLRKVTLFVLILFEGVYLCNEVLVLIINTWKSMTYKQERRKKVDKIRDSPKAKPTKSNVVASRNGNEGSSVSKGLLSCTDVISKPQKDTVSIQRPSTPDLLEGHLDAMFIQRKTETIHSPAKDTKNTNHVVAALKYGATSQPQLNHRVSGQVLKPATFSGQISSPIFSGKLLRPAMFSSPYNNVSSNKNKDIQTFSKMTISEYEKKTSRSKPIRKQDVMEDEKPKGVEVVKSNKNQTRICTWYNIIIFVFIFSVMCNIILAYKLSSVSR